MPHNKKAAIMIAASVTVFFYMSTDGYDLCYLETFHRQLISPFADLLPYFLFHQFLHKCHHLALFVQNETCDFVPFPFSFHDVFASLVYPFSKKAFLSCLGNKYYISFLYIYMNDTSLGRDFFPICRKKRNQPTIGQFQRRVKHIREDYMFIISSLT